MCGCMLLHATMDHTRQQPVVQPKGGLDAASGAGAQRCKHCGFPVVQDFSFCPGCGYDAHQLQRCPNCEYDQLILPGAETRYCVRCGEALQA